MEKKDFVVALNQEAIVFPIEHLCPRCAHDLEQTDSAPKMVEHLIKLSVDEAKSPIMKKLDEFLAFKQTQTR